MTKEKLAELVAYKLAKVAAAAKSAAELAAKSAAVMSWAKFQSAYATQET